MPKRVTSEEYFCRVRAIHGDRYDYSKSVYFNMHSKIEIICPEHGVFWQSAQAHLKGQGCPVCGRQKQKQTIMKKYGVDNPMKVDAIQKKARQTCLKKYGHEWARSTEEVQEKARQTNMERRGVEYPLQDKVVRQKMSETLAERYGVSNIAKLQSVCDQIKMTKFEKGTFHTSQSEEILFQMLCDVFGIDDVLRQYGSDVYPFACDFYIRSRDMYIELNGTWTHGTHWFEGSSDDMAVLQDWSQRKTVYYQNAVRVWSETDVRKRCVAEKNNLNYVVFWDSGLRDAKVWFAMHCPDSHDWFRMYDWLPVRKMEQFAPYRKLTGTSKNLSQIAKSYQMNVFYRNEIALWNQNSTFRGLLLQMWLYANRLQYLHKTPDMLSDAELLRGFTIAGIWKGYTVFDVSMMDKVVNTYGIKSVYDPCAGWGERMLYCYYHDLYYHGVDVNTALQLGYEKLISDFGMVNQQVAFADARTYDCMFSVDAVITCPPYGNIEQYSKDGAENLDSVAFLEWWEAVVQKSLDAHISYFCFQVNQKWKEKMTNVVERNGFVLVEEFQLKNVRSSHFTRKNGSNKKREFESMMVLKHI